MRGEEIFGFLLTDDYPTDDFSDEYRYVKGYLWDICANIEKKVKNVENDCLICIVRPGLIFTTYVCEGTVSFGIYNKHDKTLYQQACASELASINKSVFENLVIRFTAMAESASKRNTSLARGTEITDAWDNVFTKQNTLNDR